MANNTGKKYGGREQGTPNKITKELREILKDVIQFEIEKLQEYLNSLDTEKRIEIVIKLLPYILPKLEAEKPNDFIQPIAVNIIKVDEEGNIKTKEEYSYPSYISPTRIS